MIKAKKGKCIDCPEDKPEQWLAKNKPPLCKLHNFKRKQAKKKEAGKTPYKYVRKATGELQLFEQIMADRPHVSEISGLPIHRITPSCFMHVLAKGQNKYPLFKLEPRNILFVLPEEHAEWDQGLRDRLRDDPDWDKVFNLEEELKQEYKIMLDKLKLS